jgi:divalent metal cation (Fe/Co/Zn/Cd) transporter
VASDDESARTVVVALLANVGIVVAKLAAAIITGSAAMFAETVHSAADTGNSVLLLVAQHRSARPAAPSGLSRGREAYFWALLAAIGVFVVGAVLALYEGVRELLAPIRRSQMSTSACRRGAARFAPRDSSRSRPARDARRRTARRSR